MKIIRLMVDEGQSNYCTCLEHSYNSSNVSRNASEYLSHSLVSSVFVLPKVCLLCETDGTNPIQNTQGIKSHLSKWSSIWTAFLLGKYYSCWLVEEFLKSTRKFHRTFFLAINLVNMLACRSCYSLYSTFSSDPTVVTHVDAHVQSCAYPW